MTYATKQSHLPGPWIIDHERPRYSIGSEWQLSETSPPPHPGALDRVVAQTPGDSPADEANARLIAAAPAMLSALEVAADRLSYMGNHDAAREAYQLLSEIMGYANPYDQ